MVAALILGGNVQVPEGKTVGGTFAHIPACTAPGQTGCVIAYSSFSSTPPADSLFGRPGQGVSLQSDQRTRKGQQVLCTNPAALGSTAAAPLTPYFISRSRPGRGALGDLPGPLHGNVREQGRGHLAPDRRPGGGSRPVVTPTLGAEWGLHADDVNLALGNLVDDVQAAEATYAAHHPAS